MQPAREQLQIEFGGKANCAMNGMGHLRNLQRCFARTRFRDGNPQRIDLRKRVLLCGCRSVPGRRQACNSCGHPRSERFFGHQ